MSIITTTHGNWNGECVKEENGLFWLTHPYLDVWLIFESEKDREIISEAFNEIEAHTATAYSSDF